MRLRLLMLLVALFSGAASNAKNPVHDDWLHVSVPSTPQKEATSFFVLHGLPRVFNLRLHYTDSTLVEHKNTLASETGVLLLLEPNKPLASIALQYELESQEKQAPSIKAIDSHLTRGQWLGVNRLIEPAELDMRETPQMLKRFAEQAVSEIDSEFAQIATAYFVSRLVSFGYATTCDEFFGSEFTNTNFNLFRTPNLRFQRARCNRINFRLEESESELREILDTLSRDPDLYGQSLNLSAMDELATSLMMQGVFSSNEDKKQEALSWLSKSEPLIRAIGDAWRLGRNFGHQSPFYFDIDSSKAENLLMQSITAHQRIGNTPELAETYINLARVYQTHEDFELAIGSLQQALAIGDEFYKGESFGLLNLHLGRLLFDITDYESALFHMTEAQKYIDNKFYLAIANLYAGKVLRQAGQMDQAKIKLDAAREKFLEKSSTHYLIDAEVELHKLLTSNGSAIDLSQQQSLSDSYFSLTEFLEKDIPVHLQAKLRLSLRNTAKLLKWHSDAEAHTRWLQQHLEQDSKENFQVRVAHALDTLKYSAEAGHAANAEQAFFQYMKLLEEPLKKLGRNRLGLKWSNRIHEAKSILLLKLTQDYTANPDHQKLQAILSVMERALDIAGISVKPSSVSNASQYLNNIAVADYNLLNQKNKLKESAAVFQRNRTALYLAEAEYIENAPILPISRIQRRMAEHEIAFRIYQGSDQAYLVWINQRSSGLVMLEQASKIATEVKELNDKLAYRRTNYHEHLAVLERRLKLQQWLPADVDKVIYVPFGYLDSIPLDLLLNNSGQRLIQIVKSPSLSTYYSETDSSAHLERPRLYDISVIADPRFSSTGSLGSGVNATEWASGLRPLLGSRREANSISDVFSDKNLQLLLGDDATVQQFLHPDVGNSKVVHVSTHAYFNPDIPDVSGLAFAAGPEGADSLPFLSQEALKHHRLSANLVFFSGCHTGQGDQQLADGVGGLDKAALIAGANSVISTLWAVPDWPSSIFVDHFYRALKSSGDASMALAVAKKAVSNHPKFRHPYFWSGYSIVTRRKDPQEAIFNL